MSARKLQDKLKAIHNSEPPQRVIESLRAGRHTAEELLRMCAQAEHRIGLLSAVLREALHELSVIDQEHIKTMVAMLDPNLTQQQRDAALREVQADHQCQSKSATAATAMLRSRKASVAAKGGRAKAEKGGRDNETIAKAYLGEPLLQKQSARSAAINLIGKRPDLTSEKKIGQRRVEEIIRSLRKLST